MAQHFGKVKLNFPYLVKGESDDLQTVEKIKYERYLRVIFGTNLKWTEIEAMIYKANKIVVILSRIFETEKLVFTSWYSLLGFSWQN